MIQDLDTIIVQQEPQVMAAEEQVNNTVTHLEEGNKQIDLAAKKARSRRKLKWICTGIVILIILGVALGVGLGVGLPAATARMNSGTSGNSGNATRRSVDELETVPDIDLVLLPSMVTNGADLGL